MNTILGATWPTATDGRLLTILPLTLSAILVACAPVGNGGNGNMKVKVNKGACVSTIVFDRQSNPKMMRTWVLGNETIEIPVKHLPEYKKLMDQERNACNAR